MNQRLSDAIKFEAEGKAKGCSVLPCSRLDTCVDASHSRLQAVSAIKSMAEIIVKEYNEHEGYEFPARYISGGHVQMPSSAADAFFIRENATEVTLDKEYMTKAIRLCIRTLPREKGFIRRSSGIGYSGDDEYDLFIRNRREEALKQGLLFAAPSEAMKKRQHTNIFFRVEAKGKNKHEVRDFRGNRYTWRHTIKDEHGNVVSVLRPRPFYAHPPMNLAASIMYQLIDATKDSPTTCPTLEVPVVKSISFKNASSIAFADVKRMGTCVPLCLNVAIAQTFARVWKDISGVPEEYLLPFFEIAAKVPRIRYPSDVSWPVNYDDFVERESVDVGNADGAGGTTFRNNILCTYWLLKLFRRLRLPEPTTLDDLSNNKFVCFHFIGDTILLAVLDKTLGTAPFVLGQLQEIIEKESVNGSLAIEDGPTATWCGYRNWHGELVVDEVASIFKILTPEYEPGSRMRPNPIAGFAAARNKFASIPESHRVLKAEQVSRILSIYDSFVDLDFPYAIDNMLTAPDLSVYFYDPNYVNVEPPAAYFISFSLAQVIDSMRRGYRIKI